MQGDVVYIGCQDSSVKAFRLLEGKGEGLDTTPDFKSFTFGGLAYPRKADSSPVVSSVARREKMPPQLSHLFHQASPCTSPPPL